MAIDYTDHSAVIAQLQTDQKPEFDNREKVREDHYFLEKDDGQWEPDIINKYKGRPRYTFDLCNPVVNQIAGELNATDFGIRVRPSGGEASQDTAEVYNGLIRNIENMSNATHIYKAAGRDTVASGLGGWEVVQDWADSDSFDQDLLIKPISDYANRVWFDSAAELQDQSDANHVFILQQMSPEEYKERWPEGSEQSVSMDKSNQVYYYTPDLMTIGCMKWKKPVKKNLVKMTDGSVYEDDDDFKKVEDELKETGISVDRRRTKMVDVVYSRLFDGSDWLDKEAETVFDMLPVIPMFANFRISDGKIIYRGAIRKLLDAQRVYNYGKSKEIEEVALSPRAKYWMTEKQVAGHETKISTMNNNSDPVQLFNPDPENPGVPQQNGGASVNPALITMNQTMPQQIQQSAGLFGLSQGDVGDSPMSGIAIQAIQNKGDNGVITYHDSKEIAIACTGRILVGAIPKAYDSERMIRIIGEDGSEEMVKINERIFDYDTESFVELNDLASGKYDVVCDVGPAFKNRQQETIKAFNELAMVIPGLAEITADIQLKNIPTPGMAQAAERVRQQLVRNGVIPESQLTDEEKAEIEQKQLEAQQNPPELTPQEKIAEAEEQRVMAETADVESKTQERGDKAMLQANKQQHDQDMQELTLLMKQQQQAQQDSMDQVTVMAKGMEMMIKNLNLNADTLGKLKDVSGAESIMSPSIAAAIEGQVEIVTEQQEIVDEELDAFITGMSTDEIVRMLQNGG